MPSDPPTWEEIFWDLLCQMYQVYGGDCDDLPKLNLSAAVGEAVSLYNTNGDPTFGTEQERLDFLALLDDMDDHLALSGNSLSSADNTSMTNLVADLRTGASASS